MAGNISAISAHEQERRKAIAENVKEMIMGNLKIEDSDENSLMLSWNGFFLQISFSSLHPLMVIYLAKSLEKPDTPRRKTALNDLNLKSVLGSHAVNNQVGCYSYRASQWLDSELTKIRFLEMLNRCTEEAMRGYSKLAA